jgi:hypothetical protein
MTDVLHRDRTGLATALTVRLQVVSANSGRPLHGRSVRLWECRQALGPRCQDRHPVEVRISDVGGWTEFDRLLPMAGPDRWPHLHFEIHGRAGRLTLPSGSGATGGGRRTELGTAEALVMASMTGDARRGLVATRSIPVGEPAAEIDSTPGRG